MVTMDQIKRGAARYVDEEFTAKLSGWQRWAVGAGADMALENLEVSMSGLQENHAVRAMGVLDEAGNVDLDRVYTSLKKQAQNVQLRSMIICGKFRSRNRFHRAVSGGTQKIQQPRHRIAVAKRLSRKPQTLSGADQLRGGICSV